MDQINLQIKVDKIENNRMNIHHMARNIREEIWLQQNL
jgi:hypothetical protein